jgi:hypothetical protein
MKAAKPKRCLNSDQLGAKGEARFKEICEDAKLICNKSDRDRTGWDFIVEFSFAAPTGDNTLDKRRSPTSCHLQLKTIWHDTGRIALRLSSAERLAKELKPAFIYVQMVNENLEFVNSYLIHLRNQPLANILKRLRKAQKAGKLKVNHEEISFDPRQVGVRIEPNGQALRDQLRQECGDDPQTYVAGKAQELKEAGYDERPHQFKFTLHAPNKDELLDAALGLKLIDAKILDMQEVRFGVSLPSGPFDQASLVKLKIEPRPIDVCTIKVFGNDEDAPAVFQGEVFVPIISLPSVTFAIHIRTEHFTWDYRQLSPDDAGQLRIVPTEPIDGRRNSTSSWKNLFRMQIALGSDNARIEVIYNSVSLAYSHQVPRTTSPESVESFRALIDACDNIDQILGRTGNSGGTFTYGELSDLAPEVEAVCLLLSKAPAAVPFSLDFQEQPEVAQIDLLYISGVRIGEAFIACGAVVTMTTKTEVDKIVLRATVVSQPRISVILATKEAYQGFIDKFQADTGISSIMFRKVYDDGCSEVQPFET